MSLAGWIAHNLGGAVTLVERGVARPMRPDRLLRVLATLVRWGRSPAAGYIALASRWPDDTSIVDELGALTLREVDLRTNRLADAGVGEGDGVGVMCSNHRGFIETTVAVSKLGADALLLNTAFAGPQLAEVVRRERPAALIHDEEFGELLAGAARRRPRFVAWHESARLRTPTLEELIDAGRDEPLSPPDREGRVVILTSGTTGTPKGAGRANPASLDPLVSLLSKLPLGTRQVSHIAAPMFHSWGFLHFGVGLLLGTTFVLRRRFEPEPALAAIERHRCDSLVVVPVMMERILDLPLATRRGYDLSSLKVVAASGSALPGELATRWMDEFGDRLYNLYGSTEVGWATIATPDDLRAAAGTAGRPPRGTRVRLYDENGVEVPRGASGRIFVDNALQFQGDTGGGGKDVIDGLIATGDVGRLDAEGRLFVEGRDDEMIVSGGENVFPQEVEDLLGRHPAVAEAAVVGVDDREFGQRLRAYVVLEPGGRVSAKELEGYVRRNLARFKVPRARSSSCRACRATPRARSSSASLPKRRRTPRARSRPRGPAPPRPQPQFGQCPAPCAPRAAPHADPAPPRRRPQGRPGRLPTARSRS